MTNFKVERDPLYILRADEGETRPLGEMFKHQNTGDPNLAFNMHVGGKLASGEAIEVPLDFQGDILDMLLKNAEKINYKYKLFVIYDDGLVEWFTNKDHGEMVCN